MCYITCLLGGFSGVLLACLYLSGVLGLFGMKSAGVSYIKHSCGLITDEQSV